MSNNVKYANKSNLGYISLIKNIALLLVILGHAGCIYAGKWQCDVVNNNSNLIKYITEYIYSFHMPLFVFVSGYIYSYSKNILKKYNCKNAFIINKCKRLIVPYLITSILFMIPIQMIFNVYKDGDRSYINRVIFDIVLAKRPAHLWYLIMLFNIFIIFIFIEKYTKTNKYITNILLLLFISIVSIKIPNVYQISSTFKYLLYFYIGYIICEDNNIKQKLIKNKDTFFILHILVFNIMYFFINTNSENIIIKIITVVVTPILSIFAIGWIYVYVIQLYNKNIYVKIINNKFYKLIDKHNFNIYLVHQPIMLSLISILKNIALSPSVLYIILFTITLFISIIASVLILTINKYINKINYKISN